MYLCLFLWVTKIQKIDLLRWPILKKMITFAENQKILW